MLAAMAATPAGRSGRASTGKIARLPVAIRDALNQRLADGQPVSDILGWINGLTEVQALLKTRVKGQPITEENISRWRHGGYAGWVQKLQTRDAIEAMSASCAGFKESTRDVLADQIALVLTARMVVELRNFDAMPEGEKKTLAWKELIWSLVLLRRGDFYAEKLRLDRERLRLSPAALAEAERPKSPLSEEEKEDRVHQILGIGNYECRWDNFAKKWVGPGTAARYEKDAIERRLRVEIEERKKAGTWPAEGGVL